MGWLDDVIEVDGGEKIRRGFYLRILAAAKAAGIDPRLVKLAQGSWSNGGASAGTHVGDGAADVRTLPLPHRRILAFNTELRRVGLISYYRSPEYGWTETGEHLHILDPAYLEGMAPSAKRQVAAYRAGLNGLADGGRDPFPRPTVEPWSPATRTARVKARWTVVRAKPARASAWVKRLLFGRRVDYIAVVRSAAGEKWLVTGNGNYVLADRTTAKV